MHGCYSIVAQGSLRHKRLPQQKTKRWVSSHTPCRSAVIQQCVLLKVPLPASQPPPHVALTVLGVRLPSSFHCFGALKALPSPMAHPLGLLGRLPTRRRPARRALRWPPMPTCWGSTPVVAPLVRLAPRTRTKHAPRFALTAGRHSPLCLWGGVSDVASGGSIPTWHVACCRAARGGARVRRHGGVEHWGLLFRGDVSRELKLGGAGSYGVGLGPLRGHVASGGITRVWGGPASGRCSCGLGGGRMLVGRRVARV